MIIEKWFLVNATYKCIYCNIILTYIIYIYIFFFSSGILKLYYSQINVSFLYYYSYCIIEIYSLCANILDHKIDFDFE